MLVEYTGSKELAFALKAVRRYTGRIGFHRKIAVEFHDNRFITHNTDDHMDKYNWRKKNCIVPHKSKMITQVNSN